MADQKCPSLLDDNIFANLFTFQLSQEDKPSPQVSDDIKKEVSVAFDKINALMRQINELMSGQPQPTPQTVPESAETTSETEAAPKESPEVTEDQDIIKTAEEYLQIINDNDVMKRDYMEAVGHLAQLKKHLDARTRNINYAPEIANKESKMAMESLNKIKNLKEKYDNTSVSSQSGRGTKRSKKSNKKSAKKVLKKSNKKRFSKKSTRKSGKKSAKKVGSGWMKGKGKKSSRKSGKKSTRKSAKKVGSGWMKGKGKKSGKKSERK
jgi:hypothetical protein